MHAHTNYCTYGENRFRQAVLVKKLLLNVGENSFKRGKAFSSSKRNSIYDA
jgi:hypothetical protein